MTTTFVIPITIPFTLLLPFVYVGWAAYFRPNDTLFAFVSVGLVLVVAAMAVFVEDAFTITAIEHMGDND